MLASVDKPSFSNSKQVG